MMRLMPLAAALLLPVAPAAAQNVMQQFYVNPHGADTGNCSISFNSAGIDVATMPGSTGYVQPMTNSYVR